MADEQKPKAVKKVKQAKEPKEAKEAKGPKEGEGSVLVAAAKTIGAAAGKIASLTVTEPAPPKSPAKPKPAKLQKKNKSRLPRKQKKALQRTAAARAKL